MVGDAASSAQQAAYDRKLRDALDSLTLESLVSLLPPGAEVRLYLHANGYPFSDPVSYALVRQGRRDDSDYFVVRARWHSSQDTPRNPLHEVQLAVRNDDPSVVIEVAECTHTWATEALAPFNNFNIPMSPKHPMGVDGVSFRLVLPDFFGGIRLNWWSSGPEAWKPVTTHVRRLLGQVESEPFDFQAGPLAFSYSVDLVWQAPGVQSQHLAAIRHVIPSLKDKPVADLIRELKGSTSIHVGVYKKNDAIINCKLAEECGLTAVMKRSKRSS